MRRTTGARIEQSDRTPPAAQELELSGILNEHGRQYVVFKTWPSNRILPVGAGDIQSFAAFRRLVARELGLLISHASHREPTAERRAAAWRRAVQRARDRGG